MLSVEQKEVTLSMLAAHVFKVPEVGTLQPGQGLVLVDSESGRQLGVYDSDGLKLNDPP
jgi:hypothetical protein